MKLISLVFWILLVQARFVDINGINHMLITEVVTVQFPPGFPVFYPPVQLSCFFSQCPVFRGDQDLSNGSSSLSLRCLGPEIFEVEILIS